MKRHRTPSEPFAYPSSKRFGYYLHPRLSTPSEWYEKSLYCRIFLIPSLEKYEPRLRLLRRKPPRSHVERCDLEERAPGYGPASIGNPRSPPGTASGAVGLLSLPPLSAAISMSACEVPMQRAPLGCDGDSGQDSHHSRDSSIESRRASRPYTHLLLNFERLASNHLKYETRAAARWSVRVGHPVDHRRDPMIRAGLGEMPIT